MPRCSSRLTSFVLAVCNDLVTGADDDTGDADATEQGVERDPSTLLGLFLIEVLVHDLFLSSV